MTFGKRLGYINEKLLQTDDLDTDLKNSLWNAFSLNLVKELTYSRLSNSLKDQTNIKEYAIKFWIDFKKERVDFIPNYTYEVIAKIRDFLFSNRWYVFYDFIEFNINFLMETSYYDEVCKGYIKECNRVLEREASAYRVINNVVTPISNEIEIKEIKDAIFNTFYPNVNLHLRASLERLSDKIKPDYRNSIKESISAVETLCRDITNENTLGDALKKFEKSGVHFNQQFRESLIKLYAYTNNKETGIRHALIESTQTPDFDEAKFMLVSCSAFINYLISKRSVIKEKINE